MAELPVPRPSTKRGRWNGFVADEAGGKALHEPANEQHRVRVEYDGHTVYVHLADEDGKGWTTMAVDRATRAVAIGQSRTQSAAATDASRSLYG